MKPVTLSGRLQAVVSMVTAGNRVCDAGCDHGFVSIYLIEQGISPSVLAMDVRRGPLDAARRHIADRGLEGRIGTRLSDGLHNYSIGEADTLVCAGMGGRLMMKILADDRKKTESFREMVLQPQSEVEQFRRWLRGRGYYITDEKMVEEDGRFYPMMRVVADRMSAEGTLGEAELCKLYGMGSDCLESDRANEGNGGNDDFDVRVLGDRYGMILLQKKDRTLADFLRREERIYTKILAGLNAKGLSDEKRRSRYAQVSGLLDDCRRAMAIVLPDGEGGCFYGDGEN